jgi:hypothetical protein
VLPGDQKIIFTDATTQVSAPAADEPPFEEQLAPSNHFVLKLRHYVAVQCSTFKGSM